MKVCANLSLLFTELPLAERVAAAMLAGFDVRPVPPQGDKITRAKGLAAQAGGWWRPRATGCGISPMARS